MKKRLQSLCFSFTPDFDALVGAFVIAQNYRIAQENSERKLLTRTTALAVALFDELKIQNALSFYEFAYDLFLEEIGLGDYSFPRGSQADIDLFVSLDEAITIYKRSEDAVLETSKEVFVILILEDVIRREFHGELGRALMNCGLDLSKLSTELELRSLSFDPRRSIQIDEFTDLAGRASSSELSDFPQKPSNQDPVEPTAVTPFYSDHPAQRNFLNRKAVAETIVTMIENVWQEKELEKRGDRSFIVHLHGRWGSGKTPILNFLSVALTRMRSKASQSTKSDSPEWVIVDYSAWRNQGLGPAWWTLMEAVYKQGRDQLGGRFSKEARRLILRDRWWRIRSSHALIALSTIAIVAVAIWLSWVLKSDLFDKDKSWFSQGLTAVASSVGIIVTIFTFGQTYRIGSARTAKVLYRTHARSSKSTYQKVWRTR